MTTAWVVEGRAALDLMPQPFDRRQARSFKRQRAGVALGGRHGSLLGPAKRCRAGRHGAAAVCYSPLNCTAPVLPATRQRAFSATPAAPDPQSRWPGLQRHPAEQRRGLQAASQPWMPWGRPTCGKGGASAHNRSAGEPWGKAAASGGCRWACGWIGLPGQPGAALSGRFPAGSMQALHGPAAAGMH
jgi:hypothetical protein